MERFAFKIDKSVKTRLQKLCRLCGMDNPNKMNILGTVAWMGGDDDIEPDLSTKIYECVGIQVWFTKYYKINIVRVRDFHFYNYLPLLCRYRFSKMIGCQNKFVYCAAIKSMIFMNFMKCAQQQINKRVNF